MDQVLYQQYAPHAVLSPYIDAYWTVTGNNTVAVPDKILPDGCVDIILNPGPAFTSDTIPLLQDQVYLVGTMTRYKQITRPPDTRLVGIRFKPGGFSFFYDPSFLKDIADKTVEFDKKLAPLIHEGTQDQDLPLLLNRFFAERLSNPSQPVLPFLESISRLNGSVTVSELARYNFVSIRRLERLFRLHLGVSPKEFINFVRYHSALEKIRSRSGRESLLHIALEYGYYDHAHLSNEIKKYTGSSPSGI